MTTLNAAREAIYQEFHTQWASATPLVFENEQYTEPEVSWVRLFVRNEDSVQESIGAAGSRHFARQGRVFVQVFTPSNTGTAAADTLADNARNILEGKTIDGVHIYHALTREAGPEGNWFLTIVEAPFTYYITK